MAKQTQRNDTPIRSRIDIMMSAANFALTATFIVLDWCFGNPSHADDSPKNCTRDLVTRPVVRTHRLAAVLSSRGTEWKTSLGLAASVRFKATDSGWEMVAKVIQWLWLHQSVTEND